MRLAVFAERKLLTVVQVNVLQSSPWMTFSTVSNRIYFGGMLLGTSTGYATGDSDVIKDRWKSAKPTYAYGTDSGTQAGEGDDFGTYWKDFNTGLQYAMNRYYSAGYGRFLTSDPYKNSAGPLEPGSWNRFTYAGDDPVNFNDPSGMEQSYLNCSCDPVDLSDEGSVVTVYTCSLALWQRGQIRGGGGHSICDSKILQPAFISIFAQMGKALNIDPIFVMALSLQESGWDLSHVFEKNSSSNGQVLNNLFGIAPGGGNNMAFSSPSASAAYWEKTYGPALANDPTTIQGFLSDLQNLPNGQMYNSVKPDWATSIEGGTWTQDQGLNGPRKGDKTIGTYQSLLNALQKCGVKLP